MDDPRVYIMDAYNRYIYPGDGFAKREYNWNSSSQMYQTFCVVS